MEKITPIGMDTSKRVFQLHGVNAAEQPVLRRKLPRGQMITFFENLTPTTIAIEACGGSHHWARLALCLSSVLPAANRFWARHQKWVSATFVDY